MRLRNIPGARETVAASGYCVPEDAPAKGAWAAVFGNKNPVRVEVGMGKGKFLTAHAAARPQINFVGIEKYSSVLLRAIERQEEDPLPNIRFVRMDAEHIAEWFAPGEADRIYLNFSDPWPKARHAKRRLTSKEFLRRYERILKPEGILEFKTDNQELFTFSLEQAALAGWTLIASTRDLHHDPALCADNILTEYEERFSSQGNPICKMVVSPCSPIRCSAARR